MFGFLRRKSAPKSIDEIAEAIDMAGGIGGGVRRPLEVTVALACADLIATGIATPELTVMRDPGDGRKEPAVDDPHYRLLRRRPNEWQTSFEFRYMMTFHAAISEEAVALVTRDDAGRALEIIPLLPQYCTKRKIGRYQTRYRVADEFGLIGDFRPDQLLIIRNMAWDLVGGLSAVKLARSALRLAESAEDNLVKLHENGGRPSGILTTETSLSAEAVSRIKEAFGKVTRGNARSGVALLDSGLDFKPMSMSNVDAQALETRRFQIEEVCRAFGVYPIMVGHSDKASTYASAEAFFAAHNRRTGQRWQRIWAEKLDEFVLDGAGPLFVEFDNQEARLAPLRDQAEFYARALGSGGSVPFMTINEVRRERGMGPIAGGDELREPAASTVAPPAEEDDDDDDTASEG
jgi:HK97 family phage portal protein